MFTRQRVFFSAYLPETEILFSAYLLLQFEFPWERITMIMTKLHFPQALWTYNNKQGYNTHSFWVPTIYQFGEWGLSSLKDYSYGETHTAICKSYRLYLPSWSVKSKVLVCIICMHIFLMISPRRLGLRWIEIYSWRILCHYALWKSAKNGERKIVIVMQKLRVMCCVRKSCFSNFWIWRTSWTGT